MQLLHPQISSFLPLCRKWLSENKHIKYLWIPYTDTVVVVQCNPPSKWRTPKLTSKYGKDEALQHVRSLYRESLKKYRCVHTLVTCYGLITQVLMHLYLLFSYWRIRQNVLSFRNRTDFNNSLYSTIVVSIQILVCPYNFFSLSPSILRFPSLYWAFI